MEADVWLADIRNSRVRLIGTVPLHMRTAVSLDGTIHYYRHPFPLMDSTTGARMKLSWLRDGAVIREEMLYDKTGEAMLGGFAIGFGALVEQAQSL